MVLTPKREKVSSFLFLVVNFFRQKLYRTAQFFQHYLQKDQFYRKKEKHKKYQRTASISSKTWKFEFVLDPGFSIEQLQFSRKKYTQNSFFTEQLQASAPVNFELLCMPRTYFTRYFAIWD